MQVLIFSKRMFSILVPILKSEILEGPPSVPKRVFLISCVWSSRCGEWQMDIWIHVEWRKLGGHIARGFLDWQCYTTSPSKPLVTICCIILIRIRRAQIRGVGVFHWHISYLLKIWQNSVKYVHILPPEYPDWVYPWQVEACGLHLISKWTVFGFLISGCGLGVKGMGLSNWCAHVSSKLYGYGTGKHQSWYSWSRRGHCGEEYPWRYSLYSKTPLMGLWFMG
jgi:hypothetical protein